MDIILLFVFKGITGWIPGVEQPPLRKALYFQQSVYMHCLLVNAPGGPSLCAPPSPGPRVQRVREEWGGGRHGLLHPGVSAAALLLQTLSGGHGEPGDGGE